MQKEFAISVFGLGKLGCTMLACFAHKGWNVTGVDIDPNFIEKINKGESPIYEPRVDELIKANAKRITATLDVQKAVEGTSISFIIVPTPSENNGSFNIEIVKNVASSMGSALKNKIDYHVVVVTSTVLPGDTSKIIEVLEKSSGKKCGKDFGVCYNPDFIALGTVVRDFLNPDMILIGESDKRAGDFLSLVHEQLVDSHPSIHRMSFENAELAKISLNAYCTLKITFANVLAEICEKLPGGNVDLVTAAIGSDSRIGNKYLKGGLSYGGPCFPRDNKAFAWAASKMGVSQFLALKTDEINDFHRNKRIPEKLISILKEVKGEKIAVLGLTYKADTTLVEESAAMSIVRSLALNSDIKISIYDPAGIKEAKSLLDKMQNVNIAQDAMACLNDADLCFIAAPWKEFGKLKGKDFKSTMKHPIVFDAWNLIPQSEIELLDYRQIGRNS
jgi:UDPglucose 6-dehydrogenase